MLALLAVVLGALSAAPAEAASAPALDQYVPSLPSAGGGPTVASGIVAERDGSGVSPATRARLARQPDGSLLLALATSPALGAPPPARPPAAASHGSALPDGSVATALQGAVSSGAMLGLLIGLAAITAGALATVLLRRRGTVRRKGL
jgi:hypothetical protein